MPVALGQAEAFVPINNFPAAGFVLEPMALLTGSIAVEDDAACRAPFRCFPAAGGALSRRNGRLPMFVDEGEHPGFVCRRRIVVVPPTFQYSPGYGL